MFSRIIRRGNKVYKLVKPVRPKHGRLKLKYKRLDNPSNK